VRDRVWGSNHLLRGGLLLDYLADLAEAGGVVGAVSLRVENRSLGAGTFGSWHFLEKVRRGEVRGK